MFLKIFLENVAQTFPQIILNSDPNFFSSKMFFKTLFKIDSQNFPQNVPKMFLKIFLRNFLQNVVQSIPPQHCP